MLYIYSANIRTGKFEDLTQWIEKNRQAFTNAQPKLWKFRDVYFTVFGLGQAHVELHWEIESYGALDEARAVARQKSDYFRLLTELHSFLDPATGRGRILSVVSDRQAIIVGC